MFLSGLQDFSIRITTRMWRRPTGSRSNGYQGSCPFMCSFLSNVEWIRGYRRVDKAYLSTNLHHSWFPFPLWDIINHRKGRARENPVNVGRRSKREDRFRVHWFVAYAGGYNRVVRLGEYRSPGCYHVLCIISSGCGMSGAWSSFPGENRKNSMFAGNRV